MAEMGDIMLKANYHTHTTFCDGDETAERMVQRALELEFSHLGFSGHMDEEIHMDWSTYVAEIARLREAYADRIDILCGVELDTLYDHDSCPGAEYVIGSTHYVDVDVPFSRAVDYGADVSLRLCDECFGGDWYAMCRSYYELEAQVFDRLHCTFVGHFDLITRFNDQMHAFDEEDPRYLGPALEAMEHLVRQGVPFEINCGAHNRGRKEELYPRRSSTAASTWRCSGQSNAGLRMSTYLLTMRMAAWRHGSWRSIRCSRICLFAQKGVSPVREVLAGAYMNKTSPAEWVTTPDGALRSVNNIFHSG